MDWNLAIERNTEALKRILASLAAMAGLGAAFTSPFWGFEADLPIEPVARSSAEKAGEIAEQSGSPAKHKGEVKPRPDPVALSPHRRAQAFAPGRSPPCGGWSSSPRAGLW